MPDDPPIQRLVWMLILFGLVGLVMCQAILRLSL